MNYSELRARLAALRRIDLNVVDVDLVKDRVYEVVRKYQTTVPLITNEQKFYRGVKLGFKPERISQISYPPAEIVTRFQRVNRPNEPKFYCSVSREAPFFELRCGAGDYVTISRWRMIKQFFVNTVGYSQTALAARGTSRKELPQWTRHHAATASPSNRMLNEFLSHEFSRDVPDGCENQYKLSVAIAERLLGTFSNHGLVYKEMPEEGVFGGILYPALAMRGNSDNLAILPHIVDECLRPEYVEYIFVKAKPGELKFEIELLDFADTFSDEGLIEWKGRRPHWEIKDNRVYKVSAEDGKWVVRGPDGESLPMT